MSVTPAPAIAPAALQQIQCVDFLRKGYHLDMHVGPSQVVAVARLMDKHGFAIDTVTGLDWIATGEMEVVYDYYHATTGWRVMARTRISRAEPQIETISGVFPGANWHERETHDFFGIHFLGHPDLTPLLLPEDATYHPLKKDFAA